MTESRKDRAVNLCAIVRMITSDNVLASIVGGGPVSVGNVPGNVACQCFLGCSVTFARDVLGFVNSKKYTGWHGNC